MRRAWALAAGLMAAGAAMAQQTVLEPSAAVQCLSPPAAERGAPAYPFAAYKQGLHGRVMVRLRFTGPGLVPAVTVLAHEGDDGFIDAVKLHVRTLRVPCLGDQPAELDIDYVFRPTDDQPVAPAVPVDPRHAARQRQMACLTRVDGASYPDYPRQALEQGAQGRVLMELRFDAPDKPPAVRLLPRVGGDAAEQRSHATRVFLDPLRSWAEGYRLPCLDGDPLTIAQVYTYRIEGSDFGFKPGLGLRELLPLVRGVRQQRLQFDTQAMGCPFNLSLLYRQPNLPNQIQETGAPVAARAPLLDWLRGIQLDLPHRALDAVYGDTLVFTVPCLKIDLNPTGVTS